MQVFVRDNNIDQALRVLKKRMQREGVFREMRRARFYEKPSEQAARSKLRTIPTAKALDHCRQAQVEGPRVPVTTQWIVARFGCVSASGSTILAAWQPVKTFS